MPDFSRDQPRPDSKVWSVSELTRTIKELLEQTFYPFWVTGEVTDLNLHSSGHVYFTLKDARSRIKAAFFRGAAAARAMNLANGTEVEVFGSLSVYEPHGNYQIIIRTIRPKGVGDLQRRFEELKQKLEAEGLFAADRKRPIPQFPSCVGVITSLDGAALHDFLQIIGRRFPDLHVRICPASVQGATAPADLIAGLRYLNQHRACDVIVLTRGGGSMEDLWAFNDEGLARAVAASAIPVISAVGHEVDFTICDFVADLRAPTPSAAAELVIGKQSEYRERVGNLTRRLRSRAALQLAAWRQRVERLAQHYVFREPLNLVRSQQQHVDELEARMTRDLKTRLATISARVEHATARCRAGHPAVRLELTRRRWHELLGRLARAMAGRHDLAAQRLTRATTRLPLLGPRQVLQRGYAILLAPDGRAVRQPTQVQPGEQLRGLLAEGELGLEVK